MEERELNAIVDFLFETGMLQKTPRSGLHFFGSGTQSVAEHINRCAYIGFMLACLDDHPDPAHVAMLCQFHDLPEARTSDLNYVHQKYARVDITAILGDWAKNLPFGNRIKEYIEEYETGETRSEQLAHDADQLEWIMTLKAQAEIGNTKFDNWVCSSRKRLKTEIGQKLVEVILNTHSDHWWHGDPNDEWWVNKGKK